MFPEGVKRPLKILAAAGALLIAPPAISSVYVDPDPDKTKELVIDFLKKGGPAAVGNAKAQEEFAKAGIDVVIGLADLGFPGAGAALGSLKNMLLGGEEKIPGIIEQRLISIENDLSTLSGNVTAIAQHSIATSNRLTLVQISNHRGTLQRLNQRVKNVGAQSDYEKQNVMFEARQLADSFLPMGPDASVNNSLWQWDNIRVKGDPAARVVKVEPVTVSELNFALEPYLQSLALLKSASAATRIHPGHDFLARHVYFLTGDTIGDPPLQTTPLIDRAAPVRCSTAGARYADNNGVCHTTITCSDGLNSRQHTIETRFTPQGATPILCTFSGAGYDQVAARLTEEVRSSPNPLPDLLQTAAKTLRPGPSEPQGQFDASKTYEDNYLYAVSGGKLHRFLHLVTTTDLWADAQKPKANPCADPKAQLSEKCNPAIAKKKVDCRNPLAQTLEECQPGFLAKPDPKVQLETPLPIGRYDVSHELYAPVTIDGDWSQFAEVLPSAQRSDGFAVYGLRPDGGLIWRRVGVNTQGRVKVEDAPRPVGSGWNMFSKVFAGGEGVLYGVKPNGDLVWYKHENNFDGAGTPQWSTRTVGIGWNVFTHLFSPGRGVIYAVKPDGTLVWYKHNGYLTGRGLSDPGSWEGPKQVGVGWNIFSKLTAGPGGFIYGVNGAGQILFYRHSGWETGTQEWDLPVTLSAGWEDYTGVFTTITQPGAAILVK